MVEGGTLSQDGELVLLCSSLWTCSLCRYSEVSVSSAGWGAGSEDGDQVRGLRVEQDGELVLLCFTLWACSSCRYSEFLAWEPGRPVSV